MTNKSDIAIGVIAGLLIIPFVLFTGLFYAWVGSYLWLWFVVPLGMPLISVWHFWGLLLFRLFFHHEKISFDEKFDGWEFVGKTFFGPLLVLGTGYLIHLWGM